MLFDSKAFGSWIENLLSTRWSEALSWLELWMRSKRHGDYLLNNHWNNHLCFCKVIEPYMTLCFAIKNGDIGLLRQALREVYLILQAPSANKPKYACEMLWQLHIFDTCAADPVLQEAYLANSLVNPRELPSTFYKIDLLLEHQNGEFKRFCANRGSFLQESDELFRLYTLSVDCLQKLQRSMNRIIIEKDRKRRHPKKNSSFDILSLADQFHQLKSTLPEEP